MPFTVVGLILLDMIGSPAVKLSYDSNSNELLFSLLKKMAAELYPNSPSIISTRPTAIKDDHIPFLRKNIPALNLIDMNNLRYWHRSGDNFETVSFESIEKISRIAVAILTYSAAYSDVQQMENDL